MMFEIINPRQPKKNLHCGVLEFIAQEGMVYLPFWMMENMHLNEGDLIQLKSASIRKGRYVKLQPQTTDFIKIANPKAVLEQVCGHRTWAKRSGCELGIWVMLVAFDDDSSTLPASPSSLSHTIFTV